MESLPMRLKALTATVSLAALLAACGGASATPTPKPATPAPPAATQPAATAEATDATLGDSDTDTDGGGTDAGASVVPAGSVTPGATKVSANTASAAELVAALTAAGVSNASRWADEIAEYRPYDASDANLEKLRTELEKYNPGQATIDAIVSVLQP
jgi:hypothetical protein